MNLRLNIQIVHDGSIGKRTARTKDNISIVFDNIIFCLRVSTILNLNAVFDLPDVLRIQVHDANLIV